MAKYKITSIPQFEPGGETNWPPDWIKNLMQNQRKTKLKTSKSNKGLKRKKSNDSQIAEETKSFSTFDPNEFIVEQPTQYTVDPYQQDVPSSERTGLEQLATQPEFGDVGYGYKRDRFTGKLDLVPAGTSTYERDMFGNLITNVKANPDAPVNYAGEKLNCGPGKRPYKGVCLTDEEYAQIQAKEEANINYWDQEEKKRIAKEEEEAYKKVQEEYKKEIDSYIATATAKGNKHKKGSLEPFRTYDKKTWEHKQPGGGSLLDWYNDENPEVAGKSAFYLDKKDLGNGNYEVRLYPRPAIQGMMVQYGVQPGEFEKFHGLDAKQLTKEYAPFLKDVHQYYLAQGQDFIDKWTKQGLSAEEAKKKLITDKNYGIKSGIESNFKDIAEHFDFENNATKYYVDDYGVMYTKDRSGNVYKYTNDPENEDFQVFNYASTDENENPFAPVNNKNYSKQGTFTWQPVDKSKSKISIDAQGDLNINGKEAQLFDYQYKGRDKKKNENTILTNYKDYITKGSKEIAQTNKLNQSQSVYAQKNAEMYDHVYGNPDKTDLEEISAADILNGNLQYQYVDEYNNTVRKINALNKKAGTQSQTDEYRKQKGKIVAEFINKVKNTGTKVGDKKVDFGALPGYQTTFTGRDINAYKDDNKYKIQRSSTTNEEANSFLRYAFNNNINPSARNIQDSQYRGEKEDWNKQWLNYEHFATSPEGRKFLEDYKKQPYFGRELFNEAYRIKTENLAQDEYNKKFAVTKQRFKDMTDNMPWYAKAIDQGMSLIQYPYDTMMDWGSGELQAPLLGIIGDQPYTADNDWLENTFGTGASRIYQENLLPMQQDPISQFTSLINPFYFAGLTGRGLNRRLVHDDPEATWGDIGMNALFAALPASKYVRAGMAARPLMALSKYAPAALKTGKYLPRIGNAVATAVTPGNALTGYFAKHALLPHTDEVTGETTPGFFVDALDKTYNALKSYGEYDPNKQVTLGDQTVGYGDYTDASDVWKNISPNLVNLYMGKSILGHSGQILNRSAGSLVGKPSLLNTSRITDPLKAPVQNAFMNFANPPRPYIHPTTGKLHYIRSINDLPAMNSNRFGINYKQKGGQILPKALNGKSVKEKKPFEIKVPKPENIRENITIPKVNTYSPSTDPIVQTIKNNLKDYNARRHFVQHLKDLDYVGKEFTGMDALKAAKSEESMNKFLKLAIEHDRTGYRQVSGEFRPHGKTLGGYGGSTDYDMYKRYTGRPMSQVEHMKLNNVDIWDPMSLGSYQASTIPFDYYGYRAGLGDVPGGDGLYLASLPEKQQYGRYQFKVNVPADFSQGNWLNWYVKYIMSKPTYIVPENSNIKTIYGGGRRDPKSGEVLFDQGYSQGKSKSLFDSSNIPTGSGLQTRRWIGTYGTQVGKVDPSFPFTDLFNMNTEDYKKMEDLKESIIKGYNTGWRGQYKEGGELQEARYGRPVKLREPLSKPKPRPIKFENMVAKTRWWPDLSETNISRDKIQNSYNRLAESNPEYVKSYWDKWNSLPQEGWHKKIRPTLDKGTLDLIKTMPPDSFSPIRFGDDYAAKGNEWYYVDPKDYYPLANWKELGLNDANKSLNDFISKLPNYGSETFKGIGDFDFKFGSDGWQVRNDMMQAFDEPQWAASNKDFFSRMEFNDLLMKQLEYDMARMKFDEMYPEDPANMLLSALRGESNRRDEDFANLFPGIGLPNWRSKFTTPKQESFLREYVIGNNHTVRQMGKLNPAALKTLNTGFDTLPKSYQDLVKNSKADTWLKTAPAKNVVSEMRGGLGIKSTDIQNATPEQLEAWRQQIIKKMYNQVLERWNRDISTPFTGGNAWREISSQPGYKNKRGGISMKLSKAEIDKYVKGGYIVEEE